MGPHADYEKVMSLIFDGRLRAVVDSIHPLQEGTAALERLQNNEMFGKLVLTP